MLKGTDLVAVILDTMRKELQGNETQPFPKEKDFFAKIGMTEEYNSYCKGELSRAQTRLKQATDRLGEIFNPINKKACGNCKRNKKGCCEGCGRAYGHFTFNNSTAAAHKEIEELASTYGFKVFGGFWTEKGCSLPREKRSITCLDYACEKMSSLMTKEQQKEVYGLIKTIRSCRHLLKANLI